MNFDEEIKSVIKKSLGESIRKHLDDHGSPLKTMVFDAIKVHNAELRNFIYDAVGQVWLDEDFKQQAKEQIRHKVARELTASFGEGIFKKCIDQLKSDPLIRSRCVAAIESIILETEEARRE